MQLARVWPCECLHVLLQEGYSGIARNIILVAEQLLDFLLDPQLDQFEVYQLEVDSLVVLVWPLALVEHLFGLIGKAGILLVVGASNHYYKRDNTAMGLSFGLRIMGLFDYSSCQKYSCRM